MSLYHKMRLANAHEDLHGPNEHKGASHDISSELSREEFAIKAVAGGQQASHGSASHPTPHMQINVAAGSMATLLLTRASGRPPAIHRMSSVPRLPSQAAGDEAEGDTAGPSTPPSKPTYTLPGGYTSMAQFGPTTELYRSSQSCVLRTSCLVGNGEVIVKRYSKARMSSRAAHKMKREIRLMYKLKGQEGVAQILSNFEDRQYYYIAMEFYSGGDLYKRSLKQVKEEPLEEHWICTKVIAPLLRVLCLLHERHMVHRDIKPENIFLTETDELRLGDFGLAIEQQQELPFLRAGTLDYMAPEVLCNPLSVRLDETRLHTAEDLLRLGFSTYNEKVDVWAVGVLVYELMSGGATPFFHDDPEATQKLIMQCDLASVHFERHQLLSPWADFVRTALQREPENRPSASQLLQHRWVQLHLQTKPRPQPTPTRRASLSRAASMPSLAFMRAPAAVCTCPTTDDASPPAPASAPASVSEQEPEAEQAPPAGTPAVSAPADQAHPPALPASKSPLSQSSSSGSCCDACTMLAAFPSTATLGLSRSMSRSSFTDLPGLADASAAAAAEVACDAQMPEAAPQPVTSSAELSQLVTLSSTASTLTLTAQPGHECSACLNGGCRNCGGSGSVGGSGGEDSEMLLAAAEPSRADSGSFVIVPAPPAVVAQQEAAPGEAEAAEVASYEAVEADGVEAGMEDNGVEPSSGPQWPWHTVLASAPGATGKPAAEQPLQTAALSVPAPSSQPPQPQRSQLTSPFSSIMTWTPSLQRSTMQEAGTDGFAAGAQLRAESSDSAVIGAGGSAALEGHRNRMVAYLLKQRVSLAKTLNIIKRSSSRPASSASLSSRSRSCSGASVATTNSSEQEGRESQPRSW